MQLRIAINRQDQVKDTMSFRRVKLTIDSNLENVPLIGIAINRLCSLIPLSDMESFQVELCVVEAVTNCIEHAYGHEQGNEVEVVFTLCPGELILEIYDSGTPLDQELLEQADTTSLEFDPSDLDNIAEKGRGLAIIKEIMDSISYRSKNGKNCFTITKRLTCSP